MKLNIETVLWYTECELKIPACCHPSLSKISVMCKSTEVNDITQTYPILTTQNFVTISTSADFLQAKCFIYYLMKLLP